MDLHSKSNIALKALLSLLEIQTLPYGSPVPLNIALKALMFLRNRNIKSFFKFVLRKWGALN